MHLQASLVDIGPCSRRRRVNSGTHTVPSFPSPPPANQPTAPHTPDLPAKMGPSVAALLALAALLAAQSAHGLTLFGNHCDPVKTAADICSPWKRWQGWESVEGMAEGAMGSGLVAPTGWFCWPCDTKMYVVCSATAAPQLKSCKSGGWRGCTLQGRR